MTSEEAIEKRLGGELLLKISFISRNGLILPI